MSTAQVNSIYTLGGSTGGTGSIIPLSNLGSMKAIVASGAAGWYAFTDLSGITSQAIYQVTAGKTFFGVGYFISTTATSGTWYLGQTATVFTDGGGAAPTGHIDYASNTGTPQAFANNSGNANTYYWVPIPVNFTAAYYPYVRLVTQSSIIIVGQEL